MLIPYSSVGILGIDSSLRSSLMIKNEQASSLTKQGCASVFFHSLSLNLHYLSLFYLGWFIAHLCIPLLFPTRE